MQGSKDDTEFADLLIEWGLLTHDELSEAIRAHEKATRNAGVAPSFSDVLVKYGYLTPRQLVDARSADSKVALYCSPCGAGFEVRVSATPRVYRCPRCQGPLEKSQTTSSDSTKLILDTVPVDVLVAQHNVESRFGKYVMLGEVGRGGLAVVRKAWDTEEKCYVALKFLKPGESGADPEKIEELIREGERAVHLRHPNVIRVFELGYIARQYYIAMEYLEGFTLADLIRHARGRSKVSPFYEDPTRYLCMLRDVARGVHYAHTRTPPLVHCDLKPANIFIELSWRPYVLDFGVAQELNPDASKHDDGAVRGSPAYMAPEQVLGKSDQIDVRTDVYGLGAILYDMLTGRPPFAGELQEVLDKNLLMVSVPRPTEILKLRSEISGGTARGYRVPPEVEAIAMRCLEKEKDKRYATAKDVADALNDVVKARPVTQHTRRIESSTKLATIQAPELPAQPEQRGAAIVKPRRLPVATLALVLLALAAGAGIAYIKWGRVGETGETPRAKLAMEMNGRAAVLQLEAAQAGYREYEEQHADVATRAWVKERLEDLEMIRELMNALEAHLTRAMPTVAVFKLRGGAIRDAKVLRASDLGLEIVADGQRQSIAWSQVHPEQFVALTNDMEMSPRTKLGLASFSLKSQLWFHAGRLIVECKNTAVDAQARALEKDMPRE